MIISIQLNDQTYQINADQPFDISIPLNFNGDQPNAYGVEQAVSTPCEAGQLVGDTRQGGSCNFEQYKFIPHCNGTHTECIGHITNKRISVRDCLKDAFTLAEVISVKPENANETDDTYSVKLNENDKLITQRSIQNLKSKIQNPEALIIRTLPNGKDKLTKEYGQYIPPFFSSEALDFIVDSGIRHLLVDLPSIDRIFDEGKLSNHRKFWKITAGEFKLNQRSRVNNTITELIYVPNQITDGNYLLNLQIAPFAADVSPSRPLLFPIQ
jgi:kynurenine formamidase